MEPAWLTYWAYSGGTFAATLRPTFLSCCAISIPREPRKEDRNVATTMTMPSRDRFFAAISAVATRLPIAFEAMMKKCETAWAACPAIPAAFVPLMAPSSIMGLDALMAADILPVIPPREDRASPSTRVLSRRDLEPPLASFPPTRPPLAAVAAPFLPTTSRLSPTARIDSLGIRLEALEPTAPTGSEWRAAASNPFAWAAPSCKAVPPVICGTP